MRNIIKKILKEEVKSDVKIGDIYTIPDIGGRLIRIEDIICDDKPRNKVKMTHSWGDVDFYHDGCNLNYKLSNDDGKTWEWEEDEDYRTEKNWVNYLVDRGYWVLVMKDDVDFFNLNESDEFEWAQETIKNTPNLDLGQKVVVRNRGAYYPTNTDAMLELGVPGMKEFKETYGKYWWESVADLDSHEEFLRSKVPSLGVPENGDVCYIVGQPLESHSDSEYWKYLLFRESDGKLFVMDGHGFEFIFENLKESEEEFGWVEKEEDFLPTDKAIAIWMEDLSPQEVDRVMSFLRDYNKWAFLKSMMKRHDWAGSSKPIRNSLSVLILHPDGGISAWTHGGNVVTQRNMWDDMVEKNQGELRIVDAQDILRIY